MNNEYIRENINVLENLSKIENKYLDVVDMIYNCFKNGNKIMIAGNGGSASDSAHIVGEFVSRFKLERKALPALALTTNNALITAIGNDYDFSNIFSRQVEAFGENNDIFIGISTSGTSKNILASLEIAKKNKIKTIFVTGKDILVDADIVINIDSNDTSIIQNAYLVFFHMICETVERKIYNENRN